MSVQAPPRSPQHPPATPAPRVVRAARSLAAVGEARWAALALVLFAVGALVELLGAPWWAWGPLLAACYAAGGWRAARDGMVALRSPALDVDLLMVVAAVGAAAIGQALDGALLIVIFATSGALEAWATRRTEDSVRGLLELAPERVVRLDDDGEVVVDAADLRVGDVVLVRPGERVGADGAVVDGSSEVDQAGITGEPMPVARTTGDEVFAGSVNGTGALRVRVARDPADSVVARIGTLVEEASRSRAGTQVFVDRLEQRYSIGVVVATLAVFAGALVLGAGLTAALLEAMTFMIVASPCAVVLATMPPLLAAIAVAGRHGVLVRSARVMERLGSVDAVVLDKTGTLTAGAPELVDVRPVGDAGGDLGADGVLALAAAAEHPSEHPLARAVVAGAHARDLPVGPADDFTSSPGRGVSARVGGRVVAVGRPAADDPVAVRAAVGEHEEQGRSTVVVRADGVVVGVLAVADRLRPGAADAVDALTAITGARPVLLTGDGARPAAVVATAVGIDDVRAGLLPEDKLAAVEELRGRGRRVLAVGDGVNDAPALAAADAGVAMGGRGADLTVSAADAVVVRDELHTLPALLDLAHRARRAVRVNLVLAASIVAVLVVWDLVGHLPLPLGVAGHEGSTVLVALNGLRLLRARFGRAPAPA